MYYISVGDLRIYRAYREGNDTIQYRMNGVVHINKRYEIIDSI